MFDISKSMPPKTQIIFKTLSKEPIMHYWTLVGGTALSMYLQHRYSEDLDFFINTKKLSKFNRSDIRFVLEKLAAIGVEIQKIDDTEENEDYIVGGVKITFCASRQHLDLKQDVEKYGNIEIANIDTIAAMKTFTILQHRIKTRDFFDYITLTKYYKNFTKPIALMQEKYSRLPYKYSEAFIEKRFLKQQPSPSDEGLEGLTLKNKPPTLEELRKIIKNQINELAHQNIEYIQALKENTTCMKLITQGIKFQKFGLTQITLPEYLLKQNEINLYKILLPFCQDINLDPALYFLMKFGENTKLINETLLYCDNVPEKLFQVRSTPQFKEIFDIM